MDKQELQGKTVENIFDTDRNINDLIGFVEVLRSDRKSDVSLRDTFFNSIKQYIA